MIGAVGAVVGLLAPVVAGDPVSNALYPVVPFFLAFALSARLASRRPELPLWPWVLLALFLWLIYLIVLLIVGLAHSQ